MKAFDTPAIFYEVGGNPVDEFWVGWECSLDSEIIGIPGNGFVKMVLPDSVDNGTSSE